VNEDIIETLRRIQCSDVACGNLRIAMGMKLAIYEIEQLRKQRDEARRIAAAQYVKRFSILEVSYETNKNEDQLTKNFYELHGWEYVKRSQNIQFFVGDDDHAKEGL
jgi:hypothetical protein